MGTALPDMQPFLEESKELLEVSVRKLFTTWKNQHYFPSTFELTNFRASLKTNQGIAYKGTEHKESV